MKVTFAPAPDLLSLAWVIVAESRTDWTGITPISRIGVEGALVCVDPDTNSLPMSRSTGLSEARLPHEGEELHVSPAALRWAAEGAGAEASARVVRPLLGGTHALTHLVETERPARQMVLRRYPVGDDAAQREAAILQALDGLDGWAPRLIDVDPIGRRTGAPSVLITRLHGHADITSVSPAKAAEQLGRVLARIHAVPLTRFGQLRDGMVAASPSATGQAPAAAVLAADGPRLLVQEQVLTHYDYWSGNVLWRGQTITGVVDWSGVSRAPRGFDVSWCRLDLVLLHGEAAAEIFLAAYQQASEAAVPEIALWDLFALTNSHRAVETWLPNYLSLGRTDLTATDLRARHTAWTRTCLTRYQQRCGNSGALSR